MKKMKTATFLPLPSLCYFETCVELLLGVALFDCVFRQYFSDYCIYTVHFSELDILLRMGFNFSDGSVGGYFKCEKQLYTQRVSLKWS